MPVRSFALRLVASLTLCAAAPAFAQKGAEPFSTSWLRNRARTLAQSAYEPPSTSLPPALNDLNYDQHRDIRFRPDQALGRKEGLDFQVQLFHKGFLFKSGVELFLVKGGKAAPVPYGAELFDYGKNVFNEPLPQDLGFAGFRVHYPLNRPEYLDELFVFLGASYFRSLGKGELYGLSSRGLAIDTALPKGEEFPIFRAFWLELPEKGAKSMVVHALLDTPSATGAYRFEVTPGQSVVMDVTATVYPRADIEKIGFAPLTSMYLHGENDRAGADDFRPEVHDSDGLLLWLGNGERLWRPLSNPSKLRVAAFSVQALRGFGVMQRDRAWTSYEDLEARYERRPSAWVEPLEGFGPGTVTLVEIPTQEEIHDNITAFYTPATPITAGSEHQVRYRLHWGNEIAPKTPVARTLATRVSAGSRQDRRKFVLDFSADDPLPPPVVPEPVKKGKRKLNNPPDAGVPVVASFPVEAVVSVSAGKLVGNVVVQQNDQTGGWRAFFELEPGEAEAIEMRCFLKRGGEAISETWSYLWTR